MAHFPCEALQEPVRDFIKAIQGLQAKWKKNPNISTKHKMNFRRAKWNNAGFQIDRRNVQVSDDAKTITLKKTLKHSAALLDINDVNVCIKMQDESRVVQLREKKERCKEKKPESKRQKRNETVRDMAKERITRREARMSTEVNRYIRANKIRVKMRLMRRARLRMMDNVRNYVDEVHKKIAGFINRNFDVFVIPPFETLSMMSP